MPEITNSDFQLIKSSASSIIVNYQNYGLVHTKAHFLLSILENIDNNKKTCKSTDITSQLSSTSDIESKREDLWMDIYKGYYLERISEVIGGDTDGRVTEEASSAASKAVEEFDRHFPNPNR